MSDNEKLAAVERMARELLAEHLGGQRVWEFRIDRAKTRLGRCQVRYDGSVLITLSKHFILLNPLEEARDTILHEIAHALAGPRANHGPVWRSIARQLGATTNACADNTVAGPPRAWQRVCADCGKEFGRYHRRSNGRRWHIPCREENGPEGGLLVFRPIDEKVWE